MTLNTNTGAQAGPPSSDSLPVVRPTVFMKDHVTGRVASIMQERWRPRRFESTLFLAVLALTVLNVMMVTPS